MRTLSLWKLFCKKIGNVLNVGMKEGGGGEVSTTPQSMNNQHMDSLLPHGVNRQQRHSDMSSCVWTDLLKV